MNKLFLIDGAAGAGKSDLVNFVNGAKNNYSINILSKVTTRAKRAKEEARETELIFITHEEFNQLKKDKVNFYSYEYYDEGYGFKKIDLLISIAKFEFTFVIIRDKELIERIKKDFAEKVQVVHVFIYTDEGLARQRLKNEGYSEDDINFRLSRIETVWEDYLLYSNVYTIINNSSITDFHTKIHNMIKEYAKMNEPNNVLYIDPSTRFELIKPLVGFKDRIEMQLKQYPYEKNVFLMMKFRDNNKDVYRFIKKRLEEKHLNCVRADATEWKRLTNNVYNPLAVLYCCKYGIALFDEAEVKKIDGKDYMIAYNTNVAYELGIMHYQRKQCLILKHASLPDVPFDLIKDLHERYTDNIEIEDIINDWLESLGV